MGISIKYKCKDRRQRGGELAYSLHRSWYGDDLLDSITKSLNVVAPV